MKIIAIITSLVFAVLLFLSTAHSEVTAQGTLGDTDIELYTLVGNITFQSHAYTTTRDFDRREPLGALTTANMEYSFLGFNSGLDLRYTTDDNKFRQTMNRISFFGSWRWIRLSGGDVSPSYSQYSLRGMMVRGGELSITPGNFSLELTGGRVNRLILQGSGNGQGPRSFEYERWLYAATIGYGRQNSSNFRLTALYGKDDTGVLPDTTGLNLPITRPLAPPAENLAITPKFQLVLFDDTFRLGAETTVSAYTRDTDSPVLSSEESGVPSLLSNIFNPRNSTRLSFAGSAETEFKTDPFDLLLSYERIEPGFESMGLRHIRDDQQVITIRPRVRLLNRRISLDAAYSMSQDNLLGSRISTQVNNNLAMNSTFQLTESVQLGAGYTRYTAFTENGDQNNQNGHRQISQVFQVFPGISWMSGSISHAFSIAGIYQTLESRFPTLDGTMKNESNTFTSTFSYSAAMPTGLSINGNANFVMGKTTDSKFTTYGFNTGIGYSFLNQKMNVGANAGLSLNEFERFNGFEDLVNRNMQLNGNATATYNIASQTSIQLNLRLLNNNIMEGDGLGFSEMEGRLQLRQRF